MKAPRVGLFGLLGSANIGNEAQLESVLAYLRADHPDAVVDAMSSGPEYVRSKYGLNAIPLLWYEKYEQRTSGAVAIPLKVMGKGIDAVRTAWWVRRHDVVIVPGAGVLEAALPLRPWGVPYAMFLLCASGRLLGTKVVLISVGASAISERATRWLFTRAARLAFYRSFRDVQSRELMSRQGVDTSADRIYPDLAFGIPTPPYEPGDPQTVGVGVMAYYGGNDDRREAGQIHASYLAKMKRFTRWLVDSGYRVRLFGGDNLWDESVVQEIVDDTCSYRPDLGPDWVVPVHISSFTELMQAVAPLGTVVATRYHNVICAAKLCKPTISLGYSPKFAVLMADLGMPSFSQFTHSLDVDRLIGQFTELQSRAAEVRQTMRERNAAKRQELDQQFAALSAMLFPADERAHALPGPAREGAR